LQCKLTATETLGKRAKSKKKIKNQQKHKRKGDVRTTRIEDHRHLLTHLRPLVHPRLLSVEQNCAMK